jgi:cytochrome P450
MDVLTEYAYDDCWDQLDRPDLGQWFGDMLSGSGPIFHFMQQFPFITPIFQMIPTPLLVYLSVGMKNMLSVRERALEAIHRVQTEVAKGEKPKQRTIFHHLLDPELNQAGHNTLTNADLVEEAFAMCVAAADTTGNAMSVATYHVLNNPGMYKTLSDELEAAFPEPRATLDYVTLEKLPYLTGVIKEGLRYVACLHNSAITHHLR